MKEFAIEDKHGTALLIVEAADRRDAEEYARGRVHGFHQARECAPAAVLEERVQATFRELGLSEAEAKIAARGRDDVTDVRRVRAMRRDVAGGGTAMFTDGEPESRSSLEDVFKSLGLSEAQAKVAAKGRS